MALSLISINSIDIPDAWFQCISSIIDNGFKYKIEHGSFINQTRLEFDYITIYIKQPYKEPYDLMLPQIPIHLNIPNPVQNGYIEQYLPYIMTDHISPNETYTYGSRIYNQIYFWADVLSKTPNTNQAVLQVAQPNDYLLSDPPCLRHIDMRIKDDQLIFYPYFRSWDLWSGLPANLAAISILQKYMADLLNIQLGPIIASSKGLHLYGYVEDLAKIRTNKI